MINPTDYPGLELTSAAATEPISLVQARAHLRIDVEGSPDVHPDDEWLTVAITGVRQWAEEFTGIALAEQTWRMSVDAFPSGTLELPVGPLVSVTSIVYTDADGNEQTVPAADYVVDATRNPGRITLADGAGWPTPIDQAASVRILFVAGHTTETLPRTIVIALLLMLGHLYKNREALTDREAYTMPLGVETFLRPHRIRLGMA